MYLNGRFVQRAEMRERIEIPFAKFHGLGNDFIVAGSNRARDRRQASTLWNANSPSASLLRRLARDFCNRHTGVGADGFLLTLPPRSRQNDARVRFFNADGSEAEMSGNGIRCAAAFLSQDLLRARALRIETLAGVKTLEQVGRGAGRWVFRVGMGRPVLDAKKIPFRAAGVSTPVLGYTLLAAHGERRVTVTSMGNPHCSLFVSDFDRIDWTAIGREIETSRLFPNRTNVEFVKVVSRREIDVRFWERGVGRTASSGTGSCAAVVASVLNGHTDRRVRVRTLAGTLRVEWTEGGEVTLTGPAEQIAQGTYYYRP